MSATTSASLPEDTRAGAAQKTANLNIKTFATSLSAGAIVFAIQIAVFLILSGNWKLRRSSASKHQTDHKSLFYRIYYYKTAFVSKAKRIQPPTSALQSFKNVFTISDRELIRVAGTDGYLFLQYLQMLLKIFIPLAVVILPILLPLNRLGTVPGVSGFDLFAWPNVAVKEKANRLWAHLILAICVTLWICYQVYLALRKFVRLRQTILTRPEHRIRASATTILVQGIPRKWLTMAALDALYDVFPGGLREIWINRNYDELQEKVSKRTKIARTLEAAETNLIIKCTKKHKEMEKKRLKQEGKKKSKQELKQDDAQHDANVQASADPGISSGNPHQIEQALQEVLIEDASASSSSSSRSSSPDASQKRRRIPIPVVGGGIQVMGEGIRDVGKEVGKIGSKMVGGFKGGFGRHDDRHVHGQGDGAGDPPLSSPMSADFSGRGTSSDTYAPLTDTGHGDEKHQEATESSQVADKEKTLASPKMSPLGTIKRSPLNPLRRISDFASPRPFRAEGEEFPLGNDTEKQEITYNTAGIYKLDSPEDNEKALWRQYMEPKDRETMRIPLVDKSWWPSLPLLGQKVDTIYYCRKELVRLNNEIEQDQANLSRFPLMNSAFIQFNHQVAAHMACQSLSHHIPQQMTPRTIEVNPKYVLWENLTMKWWVRYIKTALIMALICGMIIFWGIPTSFTGVLANVQELSHTKGLTWLAWLNDLPTAVITIIQGVLPPALLGLLLWLLPVILRFLADLSGVTTMGERELWVQNAYFAFVFIELFLVVSLSSGIAATIDNIVQNPTKVPETLAKDLPKSANYFFSYMILQALTISSGQLLQVGQVIMVLLSPLVDTTARQKVNRVLSKTEMPWGNMIPLYTNLAAIGIIYAVISPLILVMMLITFSLFWFTFRYQMLYVSTAKAETNGLIFPRAINQLFTGLYFMDLCLIGLFFTFVHAFEQGIIMIVLLALTIIFQVLVNRALRPLFTYLPITFEDEAVERDEEFQRAQDAKWQKKEDEDQRSLNSELEAKEKAERRESQRLEELDRRMAMGQTSDEIEMGRLERKGHRSDWAHESRARSRSQPRLQEEDPGHPPHKPGHKKKERNPLDLITNVIKEGVQDISRPVRDLEAQTNPAGYLFDDIDDTLEDLEPEARQKLIRRAFQHPATRALQPAIWIPHDELGITKDEIERTAAYSDKIWITSVNAGLDSQCKVMYRGLPPDRDPFDNIVV